MSVSEGDKAPAFSMATDGGGTLSLKDLKGKPVVLYFYPKDDTPGCTKQACAYRDDLQKFQDAGVKLFGVSMDDIASHDAFQSKFSLNFPLLCDPEHKLADALGVYGDHEVRGFKYTGLSRDTFLVSPEGKVTRVWRQVDPVSTSDETYAAAVAAKGG